MDDMAPNSELAAALDSDCPHEVIDAINGYMVGQRTLGEVRQIIEQTSVFLLFERRLPDSGTPLGESDLRLLDIFAATDNLFPFARAVGPQRFMQMYGYLIERGFEFDQRDLLDLCLYAYPRGLVDSDGKPTAAGQWILFFLTDHWETRFDFIKGKSANHRCLIAQLLLAAVPPYADFAWQIVEEAPPHNLGSLAARFLELDPNRFTSWARQIASLHGPGDDQDRYNALEALMTHDPARHFDLAVAAFRAPPLKEISANRWKLQRLGLETAVRFDAVAAQSLLQEALSSSIEFLQETALDLLKQFELSRALPVLQDCVHTGSLLAALGAAKALLEREWAGRRQYAQSLLDHRSKPIRAAAVDWLEQQGAAVVDDVAAQLTHKSSRARLAAVELLRRIGGEQARAHLAARLPVEKTPGVRQAIIDAIGVPTLDAPSEELPDPLALISAEAAKTMPRVATPALPWFDPQRMGEADGPPLLHWQAGELVPAQLVSYLLYRQARSKTIAVDPFIAPALAALDPQSARAWALALLNGWIARGASADQSWLLALVGALGDERVAPLLLRQAEQLAYKRVVLVRRLVDALELQGSDAALPALEILMRRFGLGEARIALDRLAAARGLTPDELDDELVPHLGFSRQGERTLDYGSRQFTVRLTHDMALSLSDHTGAPVNSLPKPRSTDDADMVSAARATWKDLKVQAPHIRRIQVARLEQALIEGRSWTGVRWRMLFLDHPLLRRLAATLVWAWDRGAESPSRSPVLFRPLEDGTLTDANDEPVALPDHAQVRLIHPVEIDDATRAAWQRHLEDYAVVPAFLQITRPIEQAPEELRSIRCWNTYAGYLISHMALVEHCNARQWNLRWSYHSRLFSSTGLEAIVQMARRDDQECTESWWDYAIVGLAFVPAGTLTFYDYLEVDDPRALPLGDVPPVVFSEAAGDLRAVAATGRYDFEWRKKVR